MIPPGTSHSPPVSPSNMKCMNSTPRLGRLMPYSYVATMWPSGRRDSVRGLPRVRSTSARVTPGCSQVRPGSYPCLAMVDAMHPPEPIAVDSRRLAPTMARWLRAEPKPIEPAELLSRTGDTGDGDFADAGVVTAGSFMAPS